MKRKLTAILLSTMLLASCSNSNSTSSDDKSSISESTSTSDFSVSSSHSDLESESSLLQSSSEVSSEESEVLSNESITESSSEFEDSSSEELSLEESSSYDNESSFSDSSETIDNPKPPREAKNITNYLASDNDIYRINITTNDGTFPTDKVNYIEGKLNITEQNENVVLYPDMNMKVKLRGNSTMEADKKPFKIKFEEKQSLFGLSKAKEWVLLANYYDKANIRNYLAYITANKLDHLGFQPSSIFVDVYFNNEYNGMYLLSEQIERGPGRVDIKDNYSEEGISSFLIEADERAKYEYAGYQGLCYVSSRQYDFLLKDPDCDDYIEAVENLNSEDEKVRKKAEKKLEQYMKDITWLQTFMDQVSNSIYDLQDYESYIDVDSFIDYYLIEEFFKNVDVGSTSQYYVIDQSAENVKLATGPVWDFDIGLGAVDGSRSDIYKWYENAEFFLKERDYYYKELFEDPEFFRKVQVRYTEVRDSVFAKVFDEIKIAQDALEKAQKRNLAKWPLTRVRKTWIEQCALSNSYYSLKTLQGHYDYLTEFLQGRLESLDREYLLYE